MSVTTGMGDWDDTIGAPVMTGFFLFVLAMAGYYAGLLIRKLHALRAAENAG